MLMPPAGCRRYENTWRKFLKPHSLAERSSLLSLIHISMCIRDSARSIAATAANGGILTPATDLAMDYSKPAYTLDETVYNKRVYNGFGKADVSE